MVLTVTVAEGFPDLPPAFPDATLVHPPHMFPLLAVFTILSTVGLTMLLRAARTAPEGFEDAQGFHALNPGDLATAASTDANFKFEDLFSLDEAMASQPWG